jgi:hypothetical protein
LKTAIIIYRIQFLAEEELDTSKVPITSHYRNETEACVPKMLLKPI